MLPSVIPRKLAYDNSTYSLRASGREAEEGCSLFVSVQYLWQRHLKVSELTEMARSGYARETCVFVTLINAWGNQLKRKKDFFCFMLSEVVLDGLSSIAFGPVVRHYNVARVCVEKTCLPRGIQGRRKRQGPNIPLQDMPLGTSLLLPGPYHPFKVTLPTLNFPYHHRLVTEPLNTHAFGGHLVKLQQSLSLGMVCLCGFQVTACQIPFLLRQ
jgi:hypothetical protein